MDGTCRTYRREEKCLLTFGRKTWREEKRPLWRAVWRWEELIVHFPFFIWHRLHRKCQTNSSSTVLFVAAATSVSSGSIIPAFQTSCHIAHPKSPTGVPPFLLQWGLPVMSMIALMNGTSVILVSMLLLPVLTKSSLHFPWVQSHAAFLQTLSLGLLVASSHSKIVRGRQTDNTGSKVIS